MKEGNCFSPLSFTLALDTTHLRPHKHTPSSNPISVGGVSSDTSEVMDQTHCAVESEPQTLVVDHHHGSNEDSSLGLQNDSVTLGGKEGRF